MVQHSKQKISFESQNDFLTFCILQSHSRWLTPLPLAAWGEMLSASTGHPALYLFAPPVPVLILPSRRRPTITTSTPRTFRPRKASRRLFNSLRVLQGHILGFFKGIYSLAQAFVWVYRYVCVKREEKPFLHTRVRGGFGEGGKKGHQHEIRDLVVRARDLAVWVGIFLFHLTSRT